MTERSRNALIGLFVLGGLAALAVLIIMFGEGKGLFSTGYMVKANFASMVGVQQGTDVSLAGVWVGKVQVVELIQPGDPSSGARAVMEISNKYKIPFGWMAKVYTPILGQPTINIEAADIVKSRRDLTGYGPTTGPVQFYATDGSAEIEGVVKNPLETAVDPDLINALRNTTEQIGILAGSFNQLISRRPLTEEEGADLKNLAPNLYSAVVKLDKILAHFDLVLGDPQVQSNFRQTLANFREASEHAKVAAAGLTQLTTDARQTMQDAQVVVVKLGQTVENTNQQIDVVGKKFAENLDKVSRVMDYLNAAGRDLAEGQGTLGMLLRDSRFYESMLLTVERIGKAADELKVLVVQWQREGLMSGFR